jgi:hypothetical protein
MSLVLSVPFDLMRSFGFFIGLDAAGIHQAFDRLSPAQPPWVDFSNDGSQFPPASPTRQASRIANKVLTGRPEASMAPCQP